MISPTRYRPKIGKLQSFAIGARKLSDALRSVPQEIRLNFQEAYAAGEVHRALTLHYQNMPDMYFNEPGWSVWISAIPRVIKHRVESLLIEHALPNLAIPWLLARAEVTGGIGETALDLVFDKARDMIVARPGFSRRALEPKLIRKTRESPSRDP